MTEFSELRRAAALSLNDAAALLGVSKSTVYRWEHGEVAADADALARLRRLGEPRLPLGDFRLTCPPVVPRS
ncbi:helix-turn-helix domain-containing protein [Tabrizicola flagellatus]|uniref:helix-turn-helix domain-containing protein n=1 Tax=Tabrizicola flagellatus TaxID=2593021 RepID=UPI0011F3B7DF|nr:helix-turn-helix transcriptional regulator [Tabrizicola flagellatus]